MLKRVARLAPLAAATLVVAGPETHAGPASRRAFLLGPTDPPTYIHGGSKGRQ